MKQVDLIPIDQSGALAKPVGALPEMIRQNCEGTASFYKVVGFVPPWIGYVGVSEECVVGGGAFKGSPQGNKAEIAYYTLPEFEGRCFATATARKLIEIARNTVSGIVITAQTLPAQNASTSLLKKLGFELAGTATDSEVGEVWEWRLNAQPTVPADGPASRALR